MKSKFMYKKSRLDVTAERLAPAQTEVSLRKFSKELGLDEFIINRFAFFPFQVLKQLFRKDIIITLYPGIFNVLKKATLRANLLRILNFNLYKLLAFRNKIVLYVTDLPIEQSLALKANYRVEKKTYKMEKKIFKKAEKICVFNEKMKLFLQEKYELPPEKFKTYEILDFWIEANSKSAIRDSDLIKIIFAGNLDIIRLEDIFTSLPENKRIVYEFFGPNGGWIRDLNKSFLQYKGLLSQKEMSDYLSSNGHFGLILLDLKNEILNDYHDFGVPSKFRSYIAAGVPVIVSNIYQYTAGIVSKEKIGLTIESLSEISKKVIEVIESEKYNKMRKRCLKLSKKITTGYFYKKTIKSILEEYE